MKRKEINLGFCPRCKEDLEGMMTRKVQEVVFCHLCSFDIEDESDKGKSWIRFAREYACEPREE